MIEYLPSVKHRRIATFNAVKNALTFKLFNLVQPAANSGGTLVLVAHDGVSRPPIHFPKGGHLLAFLSCLENGLLSYQAMLDPPLWSQKGKGNAPSYIYLSCIIISRNFIIISRNCIIISRNCIIISRNCIMSHV